MAETSRGDADPACPPADPTYEACFDARLRFRLFDRPGTFHVSPAGLALGDCLTRNLRESEIAGRVLEVGTGSGAIALLLRRLGAASVAATDICASAVKTAAENELANFGDSTIEFRQSDLYPDTAPGPRRPFDLIVFNPPGWRSPSEVVKQALLAQRQSLNLEAMFYGDDIILRFLRRLPEHLAHDGRAIIGFNSLIGIDDVIARSQATYRANDGYKLGYRLLERVEFPLMFYTDEWRAVRDPLLEQFERGRREYAATYVTKGDTIHWFYEIIEFTVQGVTTAPRPAPVGEEVGLP